MTDIQTIKNTTQTDLFSGTEHEVVLSRRKLPRFKANPFVDDVLLSQLSGLKKKFITIEEPSAIVDMQTGEISPARLQAVKEIRTDKEQFVKLFTTHLTAFFELTSNSIKVLQYVFYTAQNNAMNDDKVYLCLIDAQDYFTNQSKNLSQAAYYRGMKELVSNGFIAESTSTNIYFINPKIFFNGDRVEFITRFTIEDKPKTIDGYKKDIKNLELQKGENQNEFDK